MSFTTVTVRPLAYGDLPQVIAIERRAFPTPWSLAMFVLELSKPSGLCLAATDERDRVVGYLICARYDTVWHLMNIAVDPEMRRRGIARMLLSEMIGRAGPESDYTLEVRKSNVGAITLYVEFGFRAAGTRPRYYRDNGEDAMIMWRTVSNASSSQVPG
ncbi:MAG: ribosomal protein S18-alanine N-acetyltransferase [Solirubrobacteraceae bacterium]